MRADFGQVQARDFFVQALRGIVHLSPQFLALLNSSIWAMVWLLNDADILKLGWPGGAAEVHQPALGEYDDLLAVRKVT